MTKRKKRSITLGKCTDNKIDKKDILMIAWNYFQQHAQQRISYFNFFVAFSALITTGMISTFQENYNYHIVGIFLGCMQAFLSGMFLKIDNRNKFLTKHGEDTIKLIEKKYYPDEDLQLFSKEEIKTQTLKESCKKQFICCRPLSHGKAFIHIYYFFFFIGLTGIICSSIQCCKSKTQEKEKEKINNIINNTSTKNVQILISNDSIYTIILEKP